MGSRAERHLVSDEHVVVVDYGMGNLHSLVSAIRFLGANAEVTSDASRVAQASLLILPGVGSFPAAMSVIREECLDVAIRTAIEDTGAKILGICLGMQLLGRKSSEDGGATGLGLLNYEVREFRGANTSSLPIPHVGFSAVSHNPQSSLFKGSGATADYYFVHEYVCVSGTSGAVESESTYGESFLAAVESGRIFGTQFHPEKSQTNGLRLLANFLELPV